MITPSYFKPLISVCIISISIGNKPNPHFPSVDKGILPNASPNAQIMTNAIPTTNIIIPKIRSICPFLAI